MLSFIRPLRVLTTLLFKYEFCINNRLYEFDDFFIATNVSNEYKGEWRR